MLARLRLRSVLPSTFINKWGERGQLSYLIYTSYEKNLSLFEKKNRDLAYAARVLENLRHLPSQFVPDGAAASCI